MSHRGDVDQTNQHVLHWTLTRIACAPYTLCALRDCRAARHPEPLSPSAELAPAGTDAFPIDWPRLDAVCEHSASRACEPQQMPSPTQCISRFRVCASINAGSIGLSLMLSLVPSAPGLAGTTYKWVDERGHVHFSDTPPAKTPYETVETAPAQSMSPPTPVAPLAPLSGE